MLPFTSIVLFQTQVISMDDKKPADDDEEEEEEYCMSKEAVEEDEYATPDVNLPSRFPRTPSNLSLPGRRTPPVKTLRRKVVKKKSNESLLSVPSSLRLQPSPPQPPPPSVHSLVSSIVANWYLI